MPLIGLGAGTALGIGKHFLIDKPAADRKRKVAAEQTRWSPWTGMGLGDPGEEPNLMANVMQGGLSGASFGQGMQNSGAYNDWLGRGGGPDLVKENGITQIGKFSNPDGNYFGSGVAALPMTTEMIPEQGYKSGRPFSMAYNSGKRTY